MIGAVRSLVLSGAQAVRWRVPVSGALPLLVHVGSSSGALRLRACVVAPRYLKLAVVVQVRSRRRANKALELTASASWNVANFHAPSAILARASVAGGSSA